MRITAAANPAARVLMSAFGRSRSTVQFFNCRQSQKITPEKMSNRKQLQQFLNEKMKAGMNYGHAYNAVVREHPELIPPAVGIVGVQFTNTKDAVDAATGGAPVGSPQFKTLFWLPVDATQETFAAAWTANGSTATPLNPAKIFAGLVELAQKQSSLDYDAAIAQVKTNFHRLWEAVELLSKQPV